MTDSPASHALAQEFTIIPYPFAGKVRDELVSEYIMLFESGVTYREITDMILYSMELLLNKRKKAKAQKEYDKITFQLSDMLGRLVVFEETFKVKQKR